MFQKRRLLTCLTFAFVSVASLAQIPSEMGLYDIRNYNSKEYGLPPQNFAVVQDSRGVLFFGNNSGILEYDGQNWDTILTPQQSAIRSLCKDKKGVIYVGGTNEFGYLAPTKTGGMHYVSLMNYLKTPDDSAFSQIWNCRASESGKIYFQASEKIFVWDPAQRKLKIIPPEPPNTSFHQMFKVNGTLYVRQKEVGMKRIMDSTSTLEFIQGGDMFKDVRVYLMIPTSGNEILINMMGQGLFKMVPASFSSRIQDAKQLTKVTAFPTNIDQFLNTYKVYDGIRLNEKEFSIGTLGGGDVVIDSSGKLVTVINKKSDLPDESINYQFLDAQQKLWLATNNGISRVDINSPVTKFNDKNGLEGTVQAFTRHNGKLYVATLAGVYYLSGEITSTPTEIDQPQFKKIIEGECWDLYDFKSGNKSVLLVVSNDGIWQVEGDDKVTLVKKGNAQVLCHSNVDSNRLYVAWVGGIYSSNGITSFYWNNGNWVDEGKLKEDKVNQDITTIEEEADGTLWCGHRADGVIRIKPVFKGKKIDDAEVDVFNKQHGLPATDCSNIFVSRINNHVYFGTQHGLYKFDNGSGKFKADSSLGGYFANKDNIIFRMDQSPDGSIWTVVVSAKDNGMHVGYVKNPGTHNREYISKPFIAVSKSIIQAMYHDADGITWLGGPDGIFRYDSKIKKDYDQDYYALIRKVVIGKDSVIFSGTYSDDSSHTAVIQPDWMKPSLRFAYNSLIFHFAAPTFDDESAIQYRYYLEGFENQWSDWKKENHKEYTNLSEGHYVFHVQARNIFEHESREATYEFTILSPWYRTVWAYIGYILALFALVYGAITVSTRSLRNIISERTAEVVKQKEVIEMKNKDITDSINYAKRIQEAILPTRERFKSVLPDSFILFKPKDIVSGDFYWMSEKGDTIFVAAGDCTGHGVPGAMVSVVCSNALNRAVKEFGITEPGKILDKVRDLVIETFEKSEKEDIKDGMDISLCSLNLKTRVLQWAGANNPLWYIQGNEIKEITADKQPIGISDNPRPFVTHTLQLEKNNEVYLFTDGYADQFGGPKGKKFKYKQLEAKVLEGRSLGMNTQRDNLNSAFVDWQGPLEQIDDVLIIGIRV